MRATEVSNLPVDLATLTKGMVPLGVQGEILYLLAETGEVLRLGPDGRLSLWEVPAAIADSEEVHTTPGGLVGLDLQHGRVIIRVLPWAEEAASEHVLEGPEDTTTAYSVMRHRRLSVIHHETEEAVHIDSWSYQEALGDFEYLERVSLKIPEGSEVEAVNPHWVIARVPADVNGDRLVLLPLGRPETGPLEFSSEHLTSFWSGRESLYVVERNVEGDHVYRVSPDARTTALPDLGRIGSTGGDGALFMVSAFDGIEEQVYVTDTATDTWEAVSGGDLPGKKIIGKGISAWIRRGSAGIFTDRGTRVTSLSGGRRPLEVAAPVSVNFCGAVHVTGRSQLTWTPSASSPKGTFIHLHGGPESFETDDLRFFGLLGDVLDAGWEWRSLNYRGSRLPAWTATASAWKRWRSTFEEDLAWLMNRLPEGPVVFAGWSFGASLALAAAREYAPDGVIIGGAMASLARHVDRAVDADPAHEAWFRRRFDIGGDDGDFLSGRAPDSFLATRVLSFHGREDDHCPYDLFKQTRLAWSSTVLEWNHHDLPDGMHYPEDMEGGRLVRSESARLLGRV